MRNSNALPFFLSLLSNPWRIGALTPSSKALAAAITTEVTPEHAPVLELGPGTGVFTQALLARGIPEERLALVEADHRFAALLSLRFPKARVLNTDASRLAAPFGSEKAGAVISGLPLLAIPADGVSAILQAAFACLRPGGAFHQFTYRPRCPVPQDMLDRLGLTARRSHIVARNLPPAFVYRITRKD